MYVSRDMNRKANANVIHVAIVSTGRPGEKYTVSAQLLAQSIDLIPSPNERANSCAPTAAIPDAKIARTNLILFVAIFLNFLNTIKPINKYTNKWPAGIK